MCGKLVAGLRDSALNKNKMKKRIKNIFNVFQKHFTSPRGGGRIKDYLSEGKQLLSPEEAWSKIDDILDCCSPPCSDYGFFKIPLKDGCCAVSVTETVGDFKGNTLILVRDVPRRLAMWYYLNIRENSATCNNPKFYEHGKK